MARRTKIHLASNLSFSTDVITEVIDVIAKRGSGKTYLATKLAEEMLAVGAQVVAIDPVGNWYGLRLGANGKSGGGLDIKILGGRNGDIPLEASAGVLVAKTIVETDMSVILDVSLLSKAKQRRFITEFSAALLEYRKRDPAAMHIFWEEAYRFMPQKQAKGSKNEMLEATEELVTMGRNFGIGSTIIALRSALVSKNVINQASVLVAMHTNAPGDRKVVDAWVEHQKLDKAELHLAKLKTGEAWVWWPDEFGLKAVKVDRKKTYDASATPKFGEKRKRRKLKPIDLDALQDAMAETIEKVKGEDPRLLKRRVAELEAEVQKLRSQPKEVVEVPAISEAVLKRFERLAAELTKATEEIAGVAQLSSPRAVVRATARALEHTVQKRVAKAANGHRTAPKAASAPPSDDTRIVAGALRMLKALAAVSPGGLTKKQVATAATMKSTSGTFGTYWSRLNVAGFIREGADRRWFITEEGMVYLGDDIPSQPDSPEEKLDFWCARLRGKAAEMLRFLFLNADSTFTRQELAEAVGLTHTSGTFGTYLSSLTSNNLAVRTPQREYVVSPDLMS